MLLEKATGKKAPLREATNETKWPKMQVKGGEVRKDKNGCKLPQIAHEEKGTNERRRRIESAVLCRYA